VAGTVRLLAGIPGHPVEDAMTVSDAPAPSRAATPLPRWRRPIAAVAALAVVLIAVAVGVAIGHRGARSRISPYTFDAEFNGPTGAGPNYGLATNYWLVDPCWEQACGNDSPTRYDASNAYLDGHGDLVLRADRGSGGTCGSESCRYTGVGLTMIDWAHGGAATWSQTYGTISARIKMPTGTGLWPAFWMAGADAATSRFPIDGEIDVVEGFGTEPTVVQEHAEFGAPDHTQHYGGGWALPAGESLADWHIYSVTWAPASPGRSTGSPRFH